MGRMTRSSNNSPLGRSLSRRRSTNRSVVVEKEKSEWRKFRLEREREGMVEYEEAYLSASTITDDYELSADFRHLELRDVVGCARERWMLLRVKRRRR